MAVPALVLPQHPGRDPIGQPGRHVPHVPAVEMYVIGRPVGDAYSKGISMLALRLPPIA